MKDMLQSLSTLTCLNYCGIKHNRNKMLCNLFQDDKNPGMQVYAENNTVECIVCHETGRRLYSCAIDYITKEKGLLDLVFSE